MLHRSLDVLYEVQNFECEHSSAIWVTKISLDGKYLAVAGKSGILRIFEFLQNEVVQISVNPNLILSSLNDINSQSKRRGSITSSQTVIDNFNPYYSFMKLFNETPIRVYNQHSEDIIEICWGISIVNDILIIEYEYIINC